MLHRTRALNRVTEDNTARVVLSSILLVLFHEEFERFYFVVVCDMDELVLQIT